MPGQQSASSAAPASALGAKRAVCPTPARPVVGAAGYGATTRTGWVRIVVVPSPT